MRALLFSLALMAAVSAQAQTNPLAPLDFLQGCWRGEFVGQPGVTDERCFAPMLGGRYVRDTHVVRGGPEAYAGESIYAFDVEQHRIVYTYYASDGGMSRGFAEATADGLRFPNDRYVGADGEAMSLRTTWRRERADRFSAAAEMEQGGVWREIWRIAYVRAPELSPPS